MRDMKMAGINNINNQETAASDYGNNNSVVKTGEDSRTAQQAERRITKSNNLSMLHTFHSQLHTCASDAVEIATPELDFLIVPGDAYHRTDNHWGTNHCLTRQTDTKYISV